MLFKKYSSKAEALVLIQTKLNVKLNEETIKSVLDLTFNFLKDQGNLPIGLNYTEDDRIKI